VVVVNHHLLMSDVAVRRAQQNWQEAAVLPAYTRLVIDEGHHLEDAAAMYDVLSRRPHWSTVECFEVVHNEMRAPHSIAADVLALVEPLLAAQIAGQAAKGRP